MSTDAFYTPSWLAEAVVAFSSKNRARIVADFAAGDGALLRAAELRWRTAEIVAADLCDTAVRRIRKTHENWSCTKCDFLDASSRARSRTLPSLLGEVDQILLNPPFSCRGGTSFLTNTRHGAFKCGQALAFVITALEYLKPGGELTAVLPSNALNSQKDRQAVRYLRHFYSLTCDYAASSSHFKGCRVKYVLVSLSPRMQVKKSNKVEPDVSRSSGKQVRVQVVRGTSQMHDLPEAGRTLVHTTDMRDHRVELNGHCGHPWRPSVIGPAILLPRVGAPTLDKACLYLRRKRVALSDCVIGLQCRSTSDAKCILAAFNRHREKFTTMFSGTCAPYLTVARLKSVLQELGCLVDD
ncbi:methyltransferase [Botrimarina hoheduenensis]|uniref:Methyltransferase small domain protein n=1 Tax=Botrimarina hoheduenensis TaxID=2528000 RepID=A0A5C5VTY5_9BACT|nr:Methyltransferase small domain protein [Botrimarina hoheduenensis]